MEFGARVCSVLSDIPAVFGVLNFTLYSPDFKLHRPRLETQTDIDAGVQGLRFQEGLRRRKLSWRREPEQLSVPIVISDV